MTNDFLKKSKIKGTSTSLDQETLPRPDLADHPSGKCGRRGRAGAVCAHILDEEDLVGRGRVGEEGRRDQRRPHRKAMSLVDVREILVTGPGIEFDPKVVEGFLAVFRTEETDIPASVV